MTTIQNRSEHFVFKAKFAGLDVRIMIDSGANRSYVSEGIGNRLKAIQMTKRIPYPLSMANGHTEGWITKEIPGVLQIGNRKENITLDVTRIPKYDVVLGMAWLEQNNPRVDWKKQELTFPSSSTEGKTDDRSPSKVPVVKAIWVRPQGRTVLAGSSIEELPPEYKNFEDVFKEREGLAALPEHKPWDHEIPIQEGKTPHHQGWVGRLSQKEEEFLKDYVQKLEAKGFIRKSASPISHAVIFANKKDGGLRPCIDFRQLNDITIKNRYPLPRIDDTQDRLLGAKFFTALDVRDAYYRVRMKKGEEWKTAFRTRWGLWEYQVMPFGLTNAPASFQGLINDTLKDFLDDFAVAYLDDILIFSKTYKEHVEHVKKVLQRLREKQLPIKLSKCEFHKDRIAFLGYIVSTEGLAPDPKKVEAVKDWPEPTNVKEVQAALGFMNYYRKFIKGFSSIAAPLSALTKKDTPFEFGPKCKEAFKALKDRLMSAPILAIFDPEKESTLETDASDFAIGACLTQKSSDGRMRPIAYYSRKMTAPELNYDIHDKELLAVVEAFREWRVYLEGPKYPVQVFTDHKNLLYWTTTKQLNRRQVRWAETLSAYWFKINHVRGTENGRADALSRRPDHEEGSQPVPAAILKWDNDQLIYRTPPTEVLAIMDMELDDEQKQQIISGRHDDRSAGHQGIAKTIELITRDFLWPGLRKDVKKYIEACDTCHKAKHERHRPYGLLQSSDPPSKAWSVVALDFIVKLPKSREPLTKTTYDSILVIVEELTKYAYFEPYRESSTAEDLAYIFMKTVVARHGTPEVIKSDRGTVFTSQFWKSLMDLSGTHQKLSTAYHPQTDGQTERTNQTLEQYLRCYVNYQQNNWVQLLPIAQFAFNNSTASTGISPFYANYGLHPNIEKDARGVKPIAKQAQISVTNIQKLHLMLKEELVRLSKQTTKQANKKRSEGPDFQEGEKVYILRKNIKTQRPNDKLDHTKIGPYKIKKKLGPVTFEIELPAGMNIHPVFHKSLLEKAPQDATPGPVLIHEGTQEPMWDIESIVGHEQNDETKEHRYLVKWLGYKDTENTWEPAREIPKHLIERYHWAVHGTRGPPRQAPPGNDTLCAMYEQPPGAGKIKRVLSVGRNPERYLVQWEPEQDNTWELAKDVPAILVNRFYRQINRVRTIR
jgi:hypothetical protein